MADEQVKDSSQHGKGSYNRRRACVRDEISLSILEVVRRRGFRNFQRDAPYPFLSTSMTRNQGVVLLAQIAILIVQALMMFVGSLGPSDLQCIFPALIGLSASVGLILHTSFRKGL